MKLSPNYYADRPSNRELIEEVDINTVPLLKLKNDIEEHRKYIRNPSFCSTIYNYIEGPSKQAQYLSGVGDM
jgi:hypothetical protein